MEAEPPKMSVQELEYARQVERLPLIFTKICDHTRREVVDEAGIQFREHSVHNEQYLGGQNVMVGGQKQWGGCASLPLTSGVRHPIERVPYGGLCIILNSCATHYECVELKQDVVLSSVLRHCVNHEPHVLLFSFWGV